MVKFIDTLGIAQCGNHILPGCKEVLQMTLNARNFGLAGGILWGAGMLVLTLVALWTGYAEGLLTAITLLYPGYTITLVGAVIGGVYGFIDAFIGLYVFAWLYNWFESK
jgi:hypothetical protein